MTVQGPVPTAPPASPEAEPETDPVWRRAFELIRSRAWHWRSGRRLTRSAAGYIEPRPYCDRLLAEALSDRCFLDTAHRAAFFDWACAQPGIKVLVPVLAAHDLMARGDSTAAITHLTLAMALDQEDLYAQEMWFAAHGRPIRPVDPAKRFCPNPFERLESGSQNRLRFCCPAWLPNPVGSLEDATAEAIWNSTAAQDIRASIHDGSYRYCSRMHCPMFSDDLLPRVESIRNPVLQQIQRDKSTVIPPKIRRISLSHDRSCNLTCPSCRTKLIIADRAENTRLDALTDKALLPLLLASEKVVITGSGDPFSSKHYRNVIRRLTARSDGPRIDLQTNGLLLARSWDELGLDGHVGQVLVSIDAASKPTYEAIRRNGVFEDLLANLDFLSTLRQQGRVAYVRLDFVVQALNFREMPAAARLMRGYGFDCIKFQMLRSWNTWSAEDFRRHHVGHPDHPDHAEFRSVLRDPALDRPDVYWFGFYAEPSPGIELSNRSLPGAVPSKGDARHAASRA
ncbi:radical SAM protein [Paracoccus zhejiangensis]|uniref:Radical SAM core domain-containing protein n=1 Tax=Paracoccus zhejiangensis TaxID=1077935 RepID=A0A2H5F4P1_9RHOB|nr:radical SAM protein [Paracoccus zhejiangensis]AUH66512.1 hypothetical protein CX676_19570 [Paracoccus zhejiangensis]